MIYPVNNYNQKWYNAHGFGAKTTYGYHEGADINLKTGGDSDLGQPLLAIADGVVTSVHSHTTTPTFGKHIHIKFSSKFGDRWAHYAHCQKILVPAGARVAEGQQIAELGKSGTKIAHCHFAIKKQPTGVDGIARTLEDLQKWEDPLVFIEKCMQEETQEDSPNVDDKLNDCLLSLDSSDKSLAKKVLEVLNLRKDLEEQERDNADLIKQISQARDQRDKAIREKTETDNVVKSLEKTIVEKDKRLDGLLDQIKALESANKGLIGNTKLNILIREILNRLFGRR